MPRSTGHVAPPENSVELVLALLFGPVDGCRYTEAELRAAWEVRRDEWLSRRRRGWRPWALWRLDLGQDPPDSDDQPARLDELGLLRDDEAAVLAERVRH